ncbi:titin homolog isoform X2 [Uranotaenia lowii]|uniref:titin homolog isoform X2 n=1 Tax=Uranotaenia lowii TaxID=190385 RepID=UPI0024798B85|nr:titin homolog isoform X2 [Uranotaenia lowii]
MPLYSEMYHNYIGNTPVIPAPIVASSSVYTPPSYVGVSRGYPNPITATRTPSFSRGYIPKLTPITETPRVAALTRVSSPKFIPIHIPPTYQKPRRVINTADIDVSASRYAIRDLTPKRDHFSPKASVSPEPPAPPPVNLTSPTSTTISAREQELMERVEERKARSTINRNRAVVRLNTIRARSKSRGSRGSIERKYSREEEPETSFEEDMLYYDPSVNNVKTTSWRDRLRDELSLRPKKSEVAKSPGELLLEKHLIQHDETPLIIENLAPESPPMKRRGTVRRKSAAKMPSFHEICADINSDKLDDGLNAGELRRRASQIIEDEIAQIQEQLQQSNGILQEGLEERFKEALEQHLSSSSEIPEKKKLKKVKRTRTKVLPKIDADDNVIYDKVETTVTPLKITADDPTIQSTVTPKLLAEVESIEECTVLKLPKKKVKPVEETAAVNVVEVKPTTKTDGNKKETTPVAKIELPKPVEAKKPEPPEKKPNGELAERKKTQDMLKRIEALTKLSEQKLSSALGESRGGSVPLDAISETTTTIEASKISEANTESLEKKKPVGILRKTESLDKVGDQKKPVGILKKTESLDTVGELSKIEPAVVKKPEQSVKKPSTESKVEPKVESLKQTAQTKDDTASSKTVPITVKKPEQSETKPNEELTERKKTQDMLKKIEALSKLTEVKLASESIEPQTATKQLKPYGKTNSKSLLLNKTAPDAEAATTQKVVELKKTTSDVTSKIVESKQKKPLAEDTTKLNKTELADSKAKPIELSENKQKTESDTPIASKSLTVAPKTEETKEKKPVTDVTKPAAESKTVDSTIPSSKAKPASLSSSAVSLEEKQAQLLKDQLEQKPVPKNTETKPLGQKSDILAAKLTSNSKPVTATDLEDALKPLGGKKKPPTTLELPVEGRKVEGKESLSEPTTPMKKTETTDKKLESKVLESKLAEAPKTPDSPKKIAEKIAKTPTEPTKLESPKTPDSPKKVLEKIVNTPTEASKPNLPEATLRKPEVSAIKKLPEAVEEKPKAQTVEEASKAKPVSSPTAKKFGESITDQKAKDNITNEPSKLLNKSIVEEVSNTAAKPKPESPILKKTTKLDQPKLTTTVQKPLLRKKVAVQDHEDFWGNIGTRETVHFNRRKQEIARRNEMVLLKFGIWDEEGEPSNEPTGGVGNTSPTGIKAKGINTKLMISPPAEGKRNMPQWPKPVEEPEDELGFAKKVPDALKKKEAEILVELPGQGKKTFEVSTVKAVESVDKKLPSKVDDATSKTAPLKPAEMLMKQQPTAVDAVSKVNEKIEPKTKPLASVGTMEERQKTVLSKANEESKETVKKPAETTKLETKKPEQMVAQTQKTIGVEKPQELTKPKTTDSKTEMVEKSSGSPQGLRKAVVEPTKDKILPTSPTLNEKTKESAPKEAISEAKKTETNAGLKNTNQEQLAVKQALENKTKAVDPPKVATKETSLDTKPVLKKITSMDTPDTKKVATKDLPKKEETSATQITKIAPEAVKKIEPAKPAADSKKAETTPSKSPSEDSKQPNANLLAPIKKPITQKLSPKELVKAAAPNMAAEAEKKLAAQQQQKQVAETAKQKPTQPQPGTGKPQQPVIEPKQPIKQTTTSTTPTTTTTPTVNDPTKSATNPIGGAGGDEKKPTKVVVKKVIKVVKPKPTAAELAAAAAAAAAEEAERQRKAQENVEKMKAKVNQITLNMGAKLEVEIKECAKCQQASSVDDGTTKKLLPANGGKQPPKKALVAAAADKPSSTSEGIGGKLTKNKFGAVANLSDLSVLSAGDRLVGEQVSTGAVRRSKNQQQQGLKGSSRYNSSSSRISSSSSSGQSSDSGGSDEESSSETSFSGIEDDWSSSDEEDMANDKPEKKKKFDPQKRVKLNFDQMRKCYVKEEKSPIVLVARPRPLWKVKRHGHGHNRKAADLTSSSSEAEDESGSGTDQTSSSGKSSTVGGSSDIASDSSIGSNRSGGAAKKIPKGKGGKLGSKTSDVGSDIYDNPMVIPLHTEPPKTKPPSKDENNNEQQGAGSADDENNKNLNNQQEVRSTSTSSHDSGFYGGGTAPISPKKAMETSYTYAQFQKTGKLTAPATVIPRFRKYNVDDFHFLTVLGKGSFGKVFLAELRNTEYYYAVKCLKKDVVLEDDDVECTLIERKVLALGTKHPFLCHLFCTFQTDSHLFFVMEYLNGGDLMFHIQQSGRFTEPRACFYAAEIVSGLKFLHRKGIVYRDLKLDNVLLDYDGHVRIADFGMCKLEIYLDRLADSFCGTPDYMAPEIIKGQKYNQAVDWWSFGVLVYEMLVGQSPFSGCDEDELFWSICNEIPWFPHYLSKEALKLLQSLLEKDATIRLGCLNEESDIKYHSFFDSIDWQRLERRQEEPPFKPQVRHPLDTQYFDKQFTRERARLTPIDRQMLASMNQAQFEGFTYTNPNNTLTSTDEFEHPIRCRLYYRSRYNY